MRKKTFSEEQITLLLREAESGTPVTEVCRKGLKWTEGT
jgi:hypothetical protein